jgi:outer membrane receptor protein involved in Fe transport
MTSVAPGHCGRDGVVRYIQSGIDRGFTAANAAMNPLGMNISLALNDERLPIDGAFKTPLVNAAAYTQLTLKDALVRRLALTAGLRLDYEHRKMDYDTGVPVHYNFLMTMYGATFIDQAFETESRYEGSMRKDYTQLLPRFALTYRLRGGQGGNLLYASVAKGYRSGGYNVQMFSELLQTSLRNDMMRTLAADPVLGRAMNRYMTVADNPAASSLTTYKPETSWNYEAGAHLDWLDGRLGMNASVFYMRTHNQQVTRFAATGLGRQMVNTGKSENWGGEIELDSRWTLFRHPLTLKVSYGFTQAKFVDYDGGMNGDEPVDYDGNYVPFAPRHNVAASAEYVIPFRDVYLQLGANVNAMGRVYWTEDNAVSQPFYALLGAHAGISYKRFGLNVWGKNLTSTKYSPFSFVSMGTTFSQTCRPLQLGVDLSWRL